MNKRQAYDIAITSMQMRAKDMIVKDPSNTLIGDIFKAIEVLQAEKLKGGNTDA